MRDGAPREIDFEARGLVRVHDDDIVAAARVFAAAMVDDPLHRYFVPDARHRLERLQGVYEFRLRTRREAWALPGGLHALALWEQPGRTISDSRPPWDKVRAGFALVAGGAPSALGRMLTYKSFASRVRARILPGPAWYLDTVVVDPAHQRQGLSGRLLRPLLSVAHGDSLPVFLETQSPANVAIYRRFGFVVADESTVPGTPLTHFAMVMNPQEALSKALHIYMVCKPNSGGAMNWRDRKRYLWLFALLMPCLPFAAVVLFNATGWGVWLWLGPIVILGLVPIVDVLAGRDSSNPPDDVIVQLENDRYYRWITYLFLPIQYAAFAFGFWTIANGDLSTVEKVGLSVTVGFIAGLGINTAHELGHKRESHERWLAKIALAQSVYGHFYIEHNRGHHVRVATPEDPASSRVAESFYLFWPRTVIGSARSAWRIEAKRYAARKQQPFRIGNDVLNAWLISAVLWLVMVLWLGVDVLPYLVIQAVVGFTLLEAVNYLEHYGMLRQRVGSGDRERYERVEPRHSWNANNIATNVLLYHLQRHSDHHANPTRRYQALRDYDEAPQLPSGYASMILLALVPPLWRRVMDAKVLEHFDGDMSLANIRPSRRGRVLARYPASSEQPGAAGPGVTTHRVAEVPSVAANARGGRCPGCGYTYDQAIGDTREGLPAGTPWTSVPDTWICPDCGVREKSDFVALDRASS